MGELKNGMTGNLEMLRATCLLGGQAVMTHRKAQADVVVLEVAMINEQGCWLKQHHQEPPLLLLHGFPTSKYFQTQQDCWKEHCIPKHLCWLHARAA